MPIFNTKTVVCQLETRKIWKRPEIVVTLHCQSKADALGPREARARSSKATSSEQTANESPGARLRATRRKKTYV